MLHEDKQYYPDAEKVFGKDVEALVMEEDAQALDVPIIAPPKQANFQVYEREQLVANYSLEFLAALAKTPDLIRSVAICGHLHSGKTLLCDMIVQQTHQAPDAAGFTNKSTKPSMSSSVSLATGWDLNREYKWTDNRRDEVNR